MLQDRIFNYAATLLKAGKEAELLEWADLAGTKYPAPERWQEIVSGAANNRLAKLINSKQFAEGRSFLAANASKFSAENYRRLRAILADAELFHLASGIKTIQDADEALAALDSVEHEAILTEARLKELRTFAVMKKAGFIANQRGVKEALAYADSARPGSGDSQLDALIRALKESRIAELHNAFAAAYNRRDFRQAGVLIRAALEEFPDDPRLLADRDLITALEQ
jgi:hypothetical protein